MGEIFARIAKARALPVDQARPLRRGDPVRAHRVPVQKHSALRGWRCRAQMPQRILRAEHPRALVQQRRPGRACRQPGRWRHLVEPLKHRRGICQRRPGQMRHDQHRPIGHGKPLQRRRRKPERMQQLQTAPFQLRVIGKQRRCTALGIELDHPPPGPPHPIGAPARQRHRIRRPLRQPIGDHSAHQRCSFGQLRTVRIMGASCHSGLIAAIRRRHPHKRFDLCVNFASCRANKRQQ